jgi:hypothetical protein
MAFGFDHVLFNKERCEEAGAPNAARRFYNPLGRRTLCGFVIPDFQRGLVWSTAQQQALIASVWRGIPIGTYSLNFSTDDLPDDLTNIVIDGQQRLNALRAYWDDEFSYLGYKWSEVSELDQRVFSRGQFPQARTSSRKRAEVIEYYTAMNFGGTQHTADEYVRDDTDRLAEATRAAHRRGEI